MVRRKLAHELTNLGTLLALEGLCLQQRRRSLFRIVHGYYTRGARFLTSWDQHRSAIQGLRMRTRDEFFRNLTTHTTNKRSLFGIFGGLDEEEFILNLERAR